MTKCPTRKPRLELSYLRQWWPNDEPGKWKETNSTFYIIFYVVVNWNLFQFKSQDFCLKKWAIHITHKYESNKYLYKCWFDLRESKILWIKMLLKFLKFLVIFLKKYNSSLNKHNNYLSLNNSFHDFKQSIGWFASINTLKPFIAMVICFF